MDEKKIKTVDELRAIIDELERRILEHQRLEQEMRQELVNERSKKDNYRWTNEELLRWGQELKAQVERLTVPVSVELGGFFITGGRQYRYNKSDVAALNDLVNRLIAARGKPKQEEPGEERLCG